MSDSTKISLEKQKGAELQEGSDLLRRGEFEDGWRLYESRWQDGRTPRDFSAPLWRGESLAGKRLLVHREQGVGDEILYASCFQDLIDRSAEVVLNCDQRLMPIFRRSFPGCPIYGGKPNADDWRRLRDVDCDFQTPAGNTPRYLRSHRDAFPERRAFLVADPRRVAGWRKRYAVLGKRSNPELPVDAPNIGIAWQGGRDLLHLRRAPWNFWGALFETPGVRWINLQYGDCSSQIAEIHRAWGVRVYDAQQDVRIRSDRWTDLDDLAAQIAALDLVITVPGLIAHLAGALGTATQILFTRSWGCWWITEGREALWYPSTRIARRDDVDDWLAVAAQLRGEIERLRDRPRAATPSVDSVERWRRAQKALHAGRWDAWDDWERRPRSYESDLDLPQPLWRGEDLRGRSLLIHREQGLGDEILFASCLRDFLRDGSPQRLVLTCDPRLAGLFKRSFPGAEVASFTSRTAIWKPESEEIDFLRFADVDVRLSAGSLPRYLRRSRDAFPTEGAFLRADDAFRAEARERLRLLGSGKKIGVAWQGGPDLLRLRRIPWAAWREIFLCDSQAEWVLLQHGDCRAQLRTIQDDWGTTIHAWDDLDLTCDLDRVAALIAELDLVLTVPNSVAHLAAALGTPTAVFHAPDWETWWITISDEQASSPWYPQMRILARRAETWDEQVREAQKLVSSGF